MSLLQGVGKVSFQNIESQKILSWKGLTMMTKVQLREENHSQKRTPKAESCPLKDEDGAGYVWGSQHRKDVDC